jgi:pilus assembly protein CpaB
MSPLRLIILLVAAGAAVVAVFLVRSVKAPAPAEAAAPVEIVKEEKPAKQILVAKHDLAVGQFVTVEDLAWAIWPENTATPAFTDQKTKPDAIETSVGGVVRIAMVEGEPVTAAKIVLPGDSSFMAAVLNPGMRAVSIEISAETAAGGFVLPDDRVDVLLTRSQSSPDGGPDVVYSEPILQNVRILAIDGIYSTASEGQGQALVGSRATLELSPNDSRMLITAQRAGSLSIVLRSIDDLQDKSGATATGRALSNGAGGLEKVRVYRNGAESATPVPAG